MAMLVLLLLSLLAGSLLTASILEIRIADNYQVADQVAFLAQSGIEDGRNALNRGVIVPSATSPFIDNKRLVDHSGREAGRYSVFLTRMEPLTLRSIASLGTARRSVETRVIKSGFPRLSQALTLAESFIAPSADPRMQALKTPAGLERLVRGIRRNATEVLKPVAGSAAILSSVGSVTNYRVVVVDGDCVFGNASGFGLLLVRGSLTLHGAFSWNGLILVIGKGALGVTEASVGGVEGGVFLARTREDSESEFEVLPAVLGASTFTVGEHADFAVNWNADEWDRANATFPYVPVSYREF